MATSDDTEAGRITAAFPTKHSPAPQIRDHVPVDRRGVFAARLPVRLPEREVHRPADLLVEQDAPRGPLNERVRADAEFT